MELSIYDIIKRRIITQKSVDLYKKFGKLTFEVHKDANKIMVREAVEKIWDVKVDNVRIMNYEGKNKLFGRRAFKSPDLKKAMVTLKSGYKIELPGSFETMGAQEAPRSEKNLGAEEK